MFTELPFPTIIAEATRLQGDITLLSAAQIFGTIEGEVIQQSLEPVQIGKTGWVSGQISSQGPIVVGGRVEGEIVSATKIRLLSTATVTGKLKAPVIEIRSGAMLEGSIHMEQAAVACVPAEAA